MYYNFLVPSSVLTASLGIFILTPSISGETFQYSLDLVDKMKAEWAYADYSVGTKIQCASLCHRQKERCSYFGFKEGSCNLMTESLDQSQCSNDECSDPGMRIYKLKVEIPVTTTVPSTTEKESTTTTTPKTTTEQPTSTTLSSTTPKVTTTEKLETTTTEKPKTTTTEKPETTTTEEPETTTTEKPETTTTEKPDTTTTEKPETTTTEKPETTTTEKPETTTTEKPETTTTEKPETTTTEKLETTTTEKPETTTTETPETTTAEKKTTSSTTEGTGPSTTEKPFICELPKGEVAGIECPLESLLLNGLGSKSPFFGDALSPKCYDFKEKMYGSKEDIYTFFSIDGGLTINAQCEEENSLITKFKLCVKTGTPRIPFIIIHCSPIADMERFDKVFNRSSADDDMKDTLVNCNDKTGLQKIFMFDVEPAPVTRVIFQCVLFKVPDNEVKEVVGDNPVG